MTKERISITIAPEILEKLDKIQKKWREKHHFEISRSQAMEIAINVASAESEKSDKKDEE